MKIAFHQPHLTERGTSVAMLDYAKYNESILGNISYIIFKKDHPVTNKTLEKYVKENFKCLVYFSESEIDFLLLKNGINYFYTICYGNGEFNSGVVKNLIHAVFDISRPHGYKFAGISESLVENTSVPAVPHIVAEPPKEIEKNSFRKRFSIPENSILIGRHGGPETFDLKIAHEAVKICADLGVYFIFLNTNKFINHEKVIFLPAVIDMKEKFEFIFSCDACLHGRSGGETFGLSIAEFSVSEKPVITYKYAKKGEDHHLKTLRENGYYYDSIESLVNIIFSIRNCKGINCYRKYSPENVMAIFKKVFLD